MRTSLGNQINHLNGLFCFSSFSSTVLFRYNNVLIVTSYTRRTSVPRSLSLSRPTSPDRARLVAPGQQGLSLCPCQIPQLSAGRPTSPPPRSGLLSALSGCSCHRRPSPAWTRVAPLVLSASRLTSASSTTRRLCAGNLLQPPQTAGLLFQPQLGGVAKSWLCSSEGLEPISTAWAKSNTALDHRRGGYLFFFTRKPQQNFQPRVMKFQEP